MRTPGNGRVTAVIVAGGRGTRLGLDLPKPLLLLGSRPLVSYSLEAFRRCSAVSCIVLVCGADWLQQAARLGQRWASGKFLAAVGGGERRADSVRAGLSRLPEHCHRVAIHDAARPFVSQEIILKTLGCLDRYHGAVPGLTVADTLRKRQGGVSSGTLDRNRFVLTQTPQCFHRQVLEEAFQRAERDHYTGTDDASYVERLPGARIAIVDGDPDNFKITTPQDLNRARAMVKRRKTQGFRIGQGFDAHRFTTGRPLILGGVTIPFELGLHGHSDADVLSHAIGDALLGSASLGDLGHHFPDTDTSYKGISSLLLLEKIREMLSARGFEIRSVDATLVLQLPKIAPYREEMIASLAKALKINPDCVSVKATTTEGMGPEGRGEGITCHAMVLVVEK